MPRGIYERTDQARKNISEAKKGKKHSEETKKKMSKALKGRKFSEEWKRKMSEAQRGEKGNNWKGGIRKRSDGYILTWKPDHPYSTKHGYVRRSRLVMEKMLGRYLKPGEIVHHKNEVRDDNRPDNLQLFPSVYEHLSFHRKEIQNENRIE